MDPKSRSGLAALVRERQVSSVVYCHAVCDVGKCERNPAWARRVNVDTLARLLDVLPDDVRCVYVSSDHVFGGNGAYGESAKPEPISVYGRTRVDAERLVLTRPNSLVVRAGLPIGPSVDGKSGHIDWLRYRSTKGLPITIVRDEARSVVWADDAAKRIVGLARSSSTGIRHLAASRALYRPDLAEFLIETMGLSRSFDCVGRHEVPTPHLGHVELATEFSGDLALPLPSPVDGDG